MGVNEASAAAAGSGLLGCKDASPSGLERLSRWSRHSGGVQALADQGTALWRFGTPSGGLRRFDDGGVSLWLLGEHYPGPDAGAPQPEPLEAYASQGHGRVWDQAGQFAEILWDSARRELALYRDGSAARSLYYHRASDGALVFSDRLELLVRCPLVPRRLGPAGLHEYLRFLDISPPNTIYDQVFSVEPDQLCLHGRHGFHCLERPAAEPSDHGRLGPSGMDAAAAALERSLTAAVSARIVDHERLVTFLSGGVDSAYLCALAAEQRPGGVQALTIGFTRPDLDESAGAAAIAHHLGVPHRVLRFTLEAYTRAFEDISAGADYPFADPAASPSLLAFRAALEHADLALDGTGADTLLGIMPARHHRLAVQYAARLPYPARRAIALGLGAIPVLRGYQPLVDFGDPEEVLMRWHGWSRRRIEEVCQRPVSLAQTRYYRIFRAFPRKAHLDRYSALMGNLPDDRLHVAAALTGLTVRFPFFDNDVERCVRAMPLDLRYAGGEHKRVLKQALLRHIPRQLWDRPKHGFDFPFEDLLAHDEHALLRRYAQPSHLRRLGCAGTQALSREVTAFVGGDRRGRFRVWALTVLAAWMEQRDLSA